MYNQIFKFVSQSSTNFLIPLGTLFDSNNEVIESIGDVGTGAGVTAYTVLALILFTALVFPESIENASRCYCAEQIGTAAIFGVDINAGRSLKTEDVTE